MVLSYGLLNFFFLRATAMVLFIVLWWDQTDFGTLPILVYSNPWFWRVCHATVSLFLYFSVILIFIYKHFCRSRELHWKTENNITLINSHCYSYRMKYITIQHMTVYITQFSIITSNILKYFIFSEENVCILKNCLIYNITINTWAELGESSQFFNDSVNI